MGSEESTDKVQAENEARKARDRERSKAYRLANLEKEKARVAAWAKANSEKLKAIYREKHPKKPKVEQIGTYYERNKEKCLAAAKAWREANPDKVKEYTKKWIEENPEAYKAMIKRRYEKIASSEEAREKRNARTRARKAANLEKSREKSKLYSRMDRIRNREKIQAQRKSRAELKAAPKRLAKTAAKLEKQLLKEAERAKKHEEWLLRKLWSKEREKEARRLQYIKNKERTKEQNKAWKKANPDKINAYHRKAYHTNPGKKLAHMHKRRARKSGAGGSYTNEEWLNLKTQYGYVCLCCGRHESERKLSADHVVPVSKGGSSNIDNIQPLCRNCNSAKNAKHIDYRPLFLKSSNTGVDSDGSGSREGSDDLLSSKPPFKIYVVDSASTQPTSLAA